MSDFCTKCSIEMFGRDRIPDIDVQKEFEALSDGHIVSGFICEGCGIIAIGKINGKLKVLINEWVDYDYDGLPDTEYDLPNILAIEFAAWVSNQHVLDNFWAMSNDAQEEAYRIFKTNKHD